MFAIVRTIFWAVAYIACFFLIRKFKRINKRRWYLISLIIAFVLYALSGFVPVENAFVTFSSPESAFSYTHSNNVKLVVEGTESALVIGKDGNENVTDIIAKAGTGWKISLVGDLKIINNKTLSNDAVFLVYQYKKTHDYYIVVSDPWGVGAADVSDNRNSIFHQMEKVRNVPDKTVVYTYYAYVHNLDDEYTLTVNGETFSVADEQS